MTIQQVLFTTQTNLDCKCITSAPVILCVSSEIVAPHICPEGGDDTETNYAYSTIEATVENFTVHIKCEDKFYSYAFQYDDEQLIDEATLTPGDIFGVFCEDCFSQWVKDMVGQEPYIRDNENGTLTFVSPHGCEYTFNGEFSS